MTERDNAASQRDGPDVAPLALLLENDLFFVVKVRDTLKRLGYRMYTARTLADFQQRAQASGDDRPALALVNISARGIAWEEAIRAAREAGAPVVAYGSHVDVAAQEAARQAGATSVIANSKLASDLPGVITRALQRAPTLAYTETQTSINRTTEEE
ncbi:MAG TPA: hypothetical protein VKQ36_05540 [Ktedonobacterales bacterium]|nr:hypothetical protein [Ktedonobacterales bacterium]